jgi:hypothetical protein
VVEVKPEPGYCLFVRFENGLSGRVRRLEGVLGTLPHMGGASAHQPGYPICFQSLTPDLIENLKSVQRECKKFSKIFKQH